MRVRNVAGKPVIFQLYRGRSGAVYGFSGVGEGRNGCFQNGKCQFFHPFAPTPPPNPGRPHARHTCDVSVFFILSLSLLFSARQLFSYSNIGTVNTVTGVISPTNLSLLSSSGGGGGGSSPSSSSGGGRSRCHSQTTLPRWNAQCPTGQPFITLDEDYMMTPLMSGNGGQGNGSALIDDGKCPGVGRSRRPYGKKNWFFFFIEK